MYRKCEEREVCMYSIYGNNKSEPIFTTKRFSRPNGFHYYCISEDMGNVFQKIFFQKARH